MKCSVEGCERPIQCKGLCSRHYMRLHRTGKLTTERFTGDFWTKVEMGAPETCWPWRGYRKPSGHGLTSMKGLPVGVDPFRGALPALAIEGAVGADHEVMTWIFIGLLIVTTVLMLAMVGARTLEGLRDE
jgi:hypothetical protein